MMVPYRVVKSLLDEMFSTFSSSYLTSQCGDAVAGRARQNTKLTVRGSSRIFVVDPVPPDRTILRIPFSLYGVRIVLRRPCGGARRIDARVPTGDIEGCEF